MLVAIVGFALGVNWIEYKCISHSSEIGKSDKQVSDSANNTTKKEFKFDPSTAKPVADETLYQESKSPARKYNPSEEWREHFYCKNNFSEFGIAWFTFFLFFATGSLWYVTYSLASDAKDGSEDSAANMKDSIAEAAKAATAMQTVATTMSANVELVKKMQESLPKQMRAYIAVDFGTPTYQDEKIKFGGNPQIINTGNTPAKNIGYRIAAAILNSKNPEALTFDEGNWHLNDAVLHPRQSFVIHGIVDDLFPETELEGIFTGEHRRLYVWGTVVYEDVFGGKWETNFCHNFSFYHDESSTFRYLGFYHPKHNNAT